MQVEVERIEIGDFKSSGMFMLIQHFLPHALEFHSCPSLTRLVGLH